LSQRTTARSTSKALAELDQDAHRAPSSVIVPRCTATPPRWHGACTKMCRLIVGRYDADPASIWTTAPTGQDLYRRIKAFTGFR